MRDIKFRVWDRGSKTMQYSGPVPSFSFWKYASYDRECLTTLMQFTGLYDKTGHEIYDGDVLGNENDASLLVWWNDDYACWSAKDPIGREDFGLLKNAFEDASASYEVIGNIYENPDLITGGSNR